MVRELKVPPPADPGEKKPADIQGRNQPSKGKAKRKTKPLPRTPLVVVNERVGDRRPPRELTVAEKRQGAFDLKIQGYSHATIARALDVSEARVSNYLQEAIADLQKHTLATAAEYRTLELERLDTLLLTYWPQRAFAKIGEIILRVLEQKHKLLGLQVQKHHVLTQDIPVEVTVNKLDLSKLNNEELGWLEIIMTKAGPQSNALPGQFAVLPT